MYQYNTRVAGATVDGRGNLGRGTMRARGDRPFAKCSCPAELSAEKEPMMA